MEGQELPVGWSSMELNDAGIWGSGGTPSRKNPRYYENGTIPWLVIGDLNDQAVEEFSTSITELGLINSSAKLIPTGSLLVAMYGSIGKLGITTFPCTTNQAIAFCIPNEELVELRYLFHALASAKPELIAKGQGGAQQNISQGILKEHLIPLSPLNEQRRIAAKLDTTLAAVEACRQRLDGVAAILKRFRQAVLAAATSGVLTREWREERGLGHEPFKRLNLKDLVQEPLRNGKSVRDGEGDYVLRLSCLKSDSVDWSESKRGDWDGIDVDRFLICQGDFLVARGNGSKVLVGRGCLVNEPPPRMAFPDTMIRIRPNQEKIHPVYLSIAWEHRSTRDQIEGSARTSAGIWKVAQSDLEVIRLPIPDQYEEQVEVVRRSHELFSLADQLEARLTAARKVVDRLTPALLAKAFRGELVPQDPTDEPASVLMERIRAARQAEAGAGKPSRRGRPKAAANPDQLPLDAAPVPPDFLAALLRECGALSERALLAVSELEPQRFQQQLYRELESGTAREVQADGQVLLEAVG